VHIVRRKLHIVLFIIGLTMIISGLAVVIEGPNIWVKWHPQSGVLAENATMVVRGCALPDGNCLIQRDTYPGEDYYDLVYMGRGSADARVEGNITETGGHRFYFVAIDGPHWPDWERGGHTTGAYVDARNVTECSFTFNLTREQYIWYGVRFGVENWNANEIQTNLSVVMYWNEKEVIEPTMAGVGLFTLGKFIGVFGFILIIVAAVMKLRKLDERPYRAPGS
jgi:hypothetical protein